MTRARKIARLCVLLAAAQACQIEAPFARTNPFDSGGSATLTLAGPDSVHAMAQRFTLDLQSSLGPIDEEAFVAWDAVERNVLPLANGEFIVHLASAQYVPVHLSAVLDRVIVGHTVFIGQRAASFDISCDPGVLVVPCDTLLAIDTGRDTWLRLYDANLRSVNDAPFALARAGNGVVSRDPAVAQATLLPGASAPLQLTAVGIGSTWLVLTVDDAIDSLYIEVTP